MDSKWREYERETYDEILDKHHGASVTFDAKLQGHLSNTLRQIDVLIKDQTESAEVVTAVDAKHHARPIDVKQVEGFIGLLNDVRVDRGIMVSASGYTEAALSRAFRDDVDLDLDILSLAEYREWQSSCAIPHSGRGAVLLNTPFGWVVDAKRVPAFLASLYRRGSTFDEAVGKMEFMYVNLLDRTGPAATLDELLASQEADIRAAAPGSVINLRELDTRVDARVMIRHANISDYPVPEITGFVEFTTFIFFAVLFTPPNIERRNVRKLEYILTTVLPIHVTPAA